MLTDQLTATAEHIGTDNYKHPAAIQAALQNVAAARNWQPPQPGDLITQLATAKPSEWDQITRDHAALTAIDTHAPTKLAARLEADADRAARDSLDSYLNATAPDTKKLIDQLTTNSPEVSDLADYKKSIDSGVGQQHAAIIDATNKLTNWASLIADLKCPSPNAFNDHPDRPIAALAALVDPGALQPLTYILDAYGSAKITSDTTSEAAWRAANTIYRSGLTRAALHTIAREGTFTLSPVKDKAELQARIERWQHADTQRRTA